MSADNWTMCPKCEASTIAKTNKDFIAWEKRKKSAYGTISEEDYRKILNTEPETTEPEKDTLREDYEIGIYDEKFSVRYKASCDICGFSFHFDHEQTKLDQ